MGGGVAEEVSRLGVVDGLEVGEALGLESGGEVVRGGLVAELESGSLGDGVVVGVPLELDGVADGGIDGEGDETEDTLRRCDDDGVSNTVGTGGAGSNSAVGDGLAGVRSSSGLSISGELGNAFYRGR
jgi:hypothetical protein